MKIGILFLIAVVLTLLLLPKKLGTKLPNVDRITFRVSGLLFKKVDVKGKDQQGSTVYQKSIFVRDLVNTIEDHPFYLIVRRYQTEILDTENQSIYSVIIKEPYYGSKVITRRVIKVDHQIFMVILDKFNEDGTVMNRIYPIQPNQNQIIDYMDCIQVSGDVEEIIDNQDGRYRVISKNPNTETYIRLKK